MLIDYQKGVFDYHNVEVKKKNFSNTIFTGKASLRLLN